MPKSNPQTMAEWMHRQQMAQNRQALRAGGIGPLRYGVVTTAGASPVVTMSDDDSQVTVGAWPASYSPVSDDVVLVAPFKPSQGQVAIIEVVALAGGGGTSPNLTISNTISGEAVTWSFYRVGRLAKVYATVVSAAAHSMTGGQVLVTPGARWASARQEFVQGNAVGTLVCSANTNGTIQCNTTFSWTSGSRLLFNFTYELAA